MSQTILLVDDEVSIANAIGRGLTRHGFQTLLASGVDEATSLLEQNNIELCITDINMEGKSGFDLMRHIRNHSRYSALPIVVYSGMLSSQVQKDILHFKPIGIFQKPIVFEELLSAVRKGLHV